MKQRRILVLIALTLCATSLSCSRMDNTSLSPDTIVQKAKDFTDEYTGTVHQTPSEEQLTVSEDMKWLCINTNELRSTHASVAPLKAYNAYTSDYWDEVAKSTTNMNIFYLDKAGVFFRIVTSSREYMTYSDHANQKVTFQKSSHNSLFRILSPPATLGVNQLIQPKGKSNWYLLSQKMMAQPGEEPVVFVYNNNKTHSPLTISWTLEPAGSGYFYLLNDDIIWNNSEDVWGSTRGGYLRNHKEKGVFLIQPKDKTYSDRFLVEPQCDFKVGETTLDINSPYVVVKQNEPVSITVSYKNELRRPLEHDFVVEKTFRTWSSFSDLPGLAFKISSKESPAVQLPGIRAGKLVKESDVTISSNLSDNHINTTLRATIPVIIPPRTEVTITYHFSSYRIECPYNTKLIASNNPSLRVDRAGKWTATMYVDENLDPSIDIVNIDTRAMRTVHIDRSMRSGRQRHNLQL